MQPRTQWTKTLLIESLQENMRMHCAGEGSNCREVFEIAGRFIRSWIERYLQEQFSGEEFMVLHELSTSVGESPSDETVAWVSVFVSLYFCDNFPGIARPAWIWLLREDPNNLRYAIQACRYVGNSSGAWGWGGLKQMVKNHVPPKAARAILREYGLDDLASE